MWLRPSPRACPTALLRQRERGGGGGGGEKEREWGRDSTCNGVLENIQNQDFNIHVDIKCTLIHASYLH